MHIRLFLCSIGDHKVTFYFGKADNEVCRENFPPTSRVCLRFQGAGGAKKNRRVHDPDLRLSLDHFHNSNVNILLLGPLDMEPH